MLGWLHRIPLEIELPQRDRPDLFAHPGSTIPSILTILLIVSAGIAKAYRN